MYGRNPKVLYICRNRLVLTVDFKKEIYEKWIEDPRPQTVREMLVSNGFDPCTLRYDFYKNIAYAFIRSGEPKRSRLPAGAGKGAAIGMASGTGGAPASMPGGKKGNEAGQKRQALIDTGKFVASGRGIRFSPGFEKELRDAYPQTSVRQGIMAAGFSLKDVGYYQIRRLEKELRDSLGGTTATRQPDGEMSPGRRDVDALLTNPFVDGVTAGRIRMGRRFFEWARVFRDEPIDDVLGIFFIDPASLTPAEKAAIKKRLSSSGARGPAAVPGAQGTRFEACVLRRREAALARMADGWFPRAAGAYRQMTPARKKRFCQWVDGLPKDPSGRYTKTHILKSLGITRSVYYLYVGREDFGLGEARRREAEGRDAERVRMAFEYKGFRKGSRQVYMLLPRLTGEGMGLKKIRRLMKKHGMDAGIRGPNEAGRAARKLLADTVKPDLLRRMFRLHRPNEVRVTDVTYLDYGEGRRAYGSALMDPVTGRLLAFVVSESNDLGLALVTLRAGDSHPCRDGGIFHSDQGVLYRTEQFQEEVLGRGLVQSMSKKGNCWDNAAQESFFGHFKDECEYQSCADIGGLRKRLEEYSWYYNNERGMWDKGRMTPVEYEGYLLGLDEGQFGEYLAAEEKKYKEMKERAAELAKKRYGTLGV